MADEFVIKTHLKIEIWAPIVGANTFIIGRSLIGGSNVLGSGSFGWTEMNCEISEVVIDRGVDTSQGLLPKIKIGTAEITTVGSDFDPMNNSYVAINVPIRIRYYPNPDTAPTTANTLFTGSIDSMTSSYNSFGSVTTSIHVSDDMKKALSVGVPIYQTLTTATSGARILDVLSTKVVPVYSALSINYGAYTGSAIMPIESRLDTTSGELIQEAVDAEAGAFICYANGQLSSFNRDWFTSVIDSAPDVSTLSNDYGLSSVHSTDPLHYCISDAEIGFDSTQQVNSVRAELSYSSSTFIDSTTYAKCRNQDSVDLYGENAETFSLNLNAPAGNVTQYLKEWVDALIVPTSARRVYSITADAIRLDNGKLNTGLVYTEPVIGRTRVFIQRPTYTINEWYLISGVTHTITPTHWTVNQQLWKGI